MRTIVDIPEDQVKALDLLGKKGNVSRAELVRQAVGLYLEAEQQKAAGAIDKYFGFLKDCPDAFGGMDGVEYQQKIRAEWDDRDRMYGNWALNEKADSAYEHKKADQDKDQ